MLKIFHKQSQKKFYFFFFLGGGTVTAHTFAYINNQFIITANSSKPLLHLWPVNSQEQIQGTRFVAPGKVTALAVSPDGNYCVAAVNETIYVWQICSGNMMAVLTRHYQSVTSIKFIDDGSHFISAGHDGMLLVWKLSSVLAAQSTNGQETVPLYSFSDHALPISDISIGKGGIRALLTSVSLDRTCKIYDLASGTLLLNLVFPEALTAVIVDHLDSKLYVGTVHGNIFEFNLQSPPRMKEYHVSNEALTAKQRFIGHKGAVNTLSISLDGESLLSGSADENVKLWHIPSKQLIRTIPHKGAITHAQFVLTPKAMFDQEAKLQLITNNFKRMIDSKTYNDDGNIVEILVSHPIDSDAFTGEENNNGFEWNSGHNGSSGGGATTNGDNITEVEILRAEVKRLKNINKELFEHSMKKLLNGK